MKKLLFVLAVAATMVSCSKNQVVEELPKVPIAFSNTFVENSTKAIDATYNNNNLFESFNVYGTIKGNFTDATEVNIFNGVTVEKQAATSVVWKYAEAYTQYWVPDCIYDFIALVGANTVLQDETTKMPTALTVDISSQSDVLCAKMQTNTISQTDYNEPVSFTFDHLLAKAQVTIQNTIITNTAEEKDENGLVTYPGIRYSYKVSNINISNVLKSNTYNITNNTWNSDGLTWENNIATLSFGNASGADNNNDTDIAADICPIGNTTASATSHKQILLSPATYNSSSKQLQISFTADLFLNGVKLYSKQHNLTIDNITISKGTSYNFIIKLGNPGSPIKFNVQAVSVWKPESGGVSAPEDVHVNYTPSNS